jgi:hypothetical protein
MSPVFIAATAAGPPPTRASAPSPSHHDLFLAAFITNIAGLTLSTPDEVLGTHNSCHTPRVRLRSDPSWVFELLVPCCTERSTNLSAAAFTHGTPIFRRCVAHIEPAIPKDGARISNSTGSRTVPGRVAET